MSSRAALAGARGARASLSALATLAALAALVETGTAHTRSHSYSTWSLDATGASVRVRMSRLDLTRLALDPVARTDDVGPTARYLAEHLRLLAGGAACEVPAAPRPLPGPEGWVVFGWRVECRASGARALEGALLGRVAPSHLHFARARLPEGRVASGVLSDAEPRIDLEAPGAPAPPGAGASAPAARSGVARYLGLGTRHILSGWDHLAFVLALLLLAGTLGQVAALVTAFTAAHSVTLGLATLGWVQPEPGPVEALIGFSIALAAAENAWILGGRDRVLPALFAAGVLVLAAWGAAGLSRTALLGLGLFSACHFALLRRTERPARLRVAIAFAFGLIHGFGFAGVLAELELPPRQLAPALFGFNAGVELGQLAVVCGAWPLLRALERRGGPGARAWVAEVGSAGICGLGLYWFLTRTLGG